jgi:hypothetical protein
MTPPAAPNRYKNYRFPADIISHGVWLYYRFCLSYRDVEELLFARSIIVTYETIRQWGLSSNGTESWEVPGRGSDLSWLYGRFHPAESS